MKAAAEAGVAPRVLYTSIPDHVSITDYVEHAPLAISDALVRLPTVLRTLHALPPFARAPFNTTCTFLLQQSPALDAFVQKFQSANVLPKAEYEEFSALHAHLAAVYACDEADWVSSHNDLFKPDNILFDGHRVWLVDWEASFLNDRYADLAVVANQLVMNATEEKIFLQEYFGAQADAYQLARFHLTQQVSHLFYTMAFLYQVTTANPIDWKAPVPEFMDYHRRMWAGEVDLADRDVKILYGRVHWKRVLHNVRQPRFTEALKIVAERHGTL